MNPILRWLDKLGILEDARTWTDHGMLTYLATLPMFVDYRVGLVTGGLAVAAYAVREARQWWREAWSTPSWQTRLDAIMDAAVPLIVYVLQAVALR